MDSRQTEKPTHEEWQRWAHVIIDRLTTAVHVYSKPPHEDVFMAEHERQTKNAGTLNLLRRVHALTDEAETPTESLAEVAHHDERVIAGLAVLFQEALSLLPELSADMQKLLKSPWHSKCTGRVADMLFRGPLSNEAEGIGSGHPEHGRLPEVLHNLLEREKSGDSRRPREALVRESGPRRQDEVQRRWADRSGRFRSAGQLE